MLPSPVGPQREEIDRLADQFEREFKAGDNPRIEDYLQKQPNLRANLLEELLALEIDLRRAASYQPSRMILCLNYVVSFRPADV